MTTLLRIPFLYLEISFCRIMEAYYAWRFRMAQAEVDRRQKNIDRLQAEIEQLKAAEVASEPRDVR